VASPMPLLAPVMIITLFLMLFVDSMILGFKDYYPKSRRLPQIIGKQMFRIKKATLRAAFN
jgi:hypothetical protein